jgi:hypothetical protein
VRFAALCITLVVHSIFFPPFRKYARNCFVQFLGGQINLVEISIFSFWAFRSKYNIYSDFITPTVYSVAPHMLFGRQNLSVCFATTEYTYD